MSNEKIRAYFHAKQGLLCLSLQIFFATRAVLKIKAIITEPVLSFCFEEFAQQAKRCLEVVQAMVLPLLKWDGSQREVR